jgi:hypothetical protein
MIKDKILDTEKLHNDVAMNIITNSVASGLDPHTIKGLNICVIARIQTDKGDINSITGSCSIEQVANLAAAQMLAQGTTIAEFFDIVHDKMQFMKDQRVQEGNLVKFVDPRDFEDLKNELQVDDLMKEINDPDLDHI